MQTPQLVRPVRRMSDLTCASLAGLRGPWRARVGRGGKFRRRPGRRRRSPSLQGDDDDQHDVASVGPLQVERDQPRTSGLSSGPKNLRPLARLMMPGTPQSSEIPSSAGLGSESKNGWVWNHPTKTRCASCFRSGMMIDGTPKSQRVVGRRATKRRRDGATKGPEPTPPMAEAALNVHVEVAEGAGGQAGSAGASPSRASPLWLASRFSLLASSPHPGRGRGGLAKAGAGS